jgi:peptide-methionine (S)-S-oxide reductase
MYQTTLKNRPLFFRIISFIFFSVFALFSCGQNSPSKNKKDYSSYQKAYFASGCFWCVEAVYESVDGVKEAVSGYSGGNEKNPTYNQVSAGQTSHAESVMVYYDSSVVDYKNLLRVFFSSHDPTTYHQQGPDIGSQYRSVIFYSNNNEKMIAEGFIDSLIRNKVFSKITTELVPFNKFYDAEQYHQDYKKINPNNPYVISVSNPRLEDFKKKCPDLLKK